MTGGRLDLTVTVDNVGGGAFDAVSRPRGRGRTLKLMFDYVLPTADQPDGSFRVCADGSAVPDDGGGPLIGRTTYGLREAYAAMTDLRRTWTSSVVELRVDREYPFAQQWDLSGRGLLDRVGIDLARAGTKLFDLVFREGDDGLKAIADVVADALRAGEQRISLFSDRLFAPWPMLYTSPDPGVDIEAAGAPWSLEGFWGFGHLVEHTVSRTPAWRPDLHLASGRPTVGLNVDPRVDTSTGAGPVPYVGSVREFFTRVGDVTVREERDVLGAALRSPDFGDQIVFFGCHGIVSGAAGESLGEAAVTLRDDKPIRTSDFAYWLRDRRLGSAPVVFIGACQGGQMASGFYDAFGTELLKAGANCVLGPQVDLPIPFAAHYAPALFEAFLGGARLGDAVHDLARSCATERENPLGLIISMYRGMDTHIVT